MPEVLYSSEGEEKAKVLAELKRLSDAVILEYSLALNDVDQYTLVVDLGSLNTAEAFMQSAQRAINLGLSGVYIERLGAESEALDDSLHEKVAIIWNPADFYFE